MTIEPNKQFFVIVLVGVGLTLVLMTQFGILKDGELQLPDAQDIIGGNTSDGELSDSGTTNGERVGLPAAQRVKPGTSPSAPTAGSTVKSGIAIVTPAESDVWALDVPHTILWNKAAGEAGNLYLVNADTNTLAGWVLPVSGENQVSYAWNTRDVSEGIIGGTAVSVQPGRYYLTLSLEGGLPDVRSGVFRVAPSSTAERVTRVVALRNVTMEPSQVEISRGTPIAFVNYDAAIHIITAQNTFGPFTLTSGGAYTLSTAALQPGTYNYYSNVWTYQAPGTLVIK